MSDSNMYKDEWVDKYRPKTLKDYVLNSDIKSYFKSMIKNKSLQNFLLSGNAGTGKTTLAKIIANETNAEVLFVRCATEGTIDVLRSKVEPFCNAMTMDGRQKIVILDELDSSSSGDSVNNFQKGLRTVIEAASDDTRFICTCNYIGKILPPLLSRCPLIPLKFDKKDLVIHVKKILDSENISYTKDTLKAFIEESFRFYPDIRRIIKYLQFCCNTGELIVKLNSIANGEKEEFVKDLIKQTFDTTNILDVRKFYLQNKEKLGDMLEAGSLIFNYVVDNGLVTPDGVLKLTDLLYQTNVCVDKEPQIFGMLIAISKYRS